MPLISAAMGISFLIFEKKNRKHSLNTAIFSLIYFFVSLKIIQFFNSGSYDHWPYVELGNSPLEVIQFIFLHPISTALLAFDNPKKLEMWILILFSGGFLAIFQPKYFLIILPILAQKFFSNDPIHWGSEYHYAVEFAPPIVIGAFLTLNKFHKTFFRISGAGLLLMANLYILLHVHFYDGETLSRIFYKDHYVRENRNEISEAIQSVQNARSVSAQSAFVPHLTNQEIYLFPRVEKSEYILLILNDRNNWPLNTENVNLAYQKLLSSTEYSEIFHKNSVVVFEKN
ncbi:DUF2079 domain-containing protein [Candidatus Peregrinibacteria bacterium]|nr:DUF2079 domain-containing protein [Candidatus Peregrinibacteria bacterium]